MTTGHDVEKALLKIINYKHAGKWVQNDLIKINIAKGYDAWLQDLHDHKIPLSLLEYIEYLLDTPGYFEHQNTPPN